MRRRSWTTDMPSHTFAGHQTGAGRTRLAQAHPPSRRPATCGTGAQAAGPVPPKRATTSRGSMRPGTLVRQAPRPTRAKWLAATNPLGRCAPSSPQPLLQAGDHSSGLPFPTVPPARPDRSYRERPGEGFFAPANDERRLGAPRPARLGLSWFFRGQASGRRARRARGSPSSRCGGGGARPSGAWPDSLPAR